MDVKETKNRRRAAKAGFTRCGKSLSYVMDESRSTEEVQEAIDKYCNAYYLLESRHEEYTNLLEDDEFEEEEKFIEECHQKFLELKLMAKDFIVSSSKPKEGDTEITAKSSAATGSSKMETPSSDLKSESDDHSEQMSKSVMQSVPTYSNMKVSKPSLPSFSGDVREFFEFRSDFKHLVESHVCKRDAVTMLRSCLLGKPLDMVRGLGQDYDTMWDTLETAYGNPRFISDAITNDIVKFKPLSEGEDSRFCDLVQLVRRCFNLLKEIGRTEDMDNNYVIALLEQRMTSEDKKIWSRHLEHERKEPTLSNLLEWMSVEMRLRLRAVSAVRSTARPSKPQVNQVVLNSHAEKSHKCWICNTNSHVIAQCPTFINKSVKERYELLKENRCCFSCLKKAGRNHRAHTCYHKQECSEIRNGVICKKYHHKLLHSDPVNSVGMASTQSHNNLLPVATLEIKGKETRSKSCNIMLDSGAQVSLIRNAVAQELNLSGNNVSISILKVGGAEEEIVSRVYELSVVSPRSGHNHLVKVIGIDEINDTYTQMIDTDCLSRELGIKGTVLPRCSGVIDVLIGIDHAKLHCGESVELNNLVGRNTPMGWIFFGGSSESKGQHSLMYVSLSKPVEITDFWTTEGMGVSSPNCRCSQNEQDQVNSTEMNNLCSKTRNQWTMEYPWIKNPELLPDNRVQAERLLHVREKQLQKSPALANSYDEQIKEMVSLKFARKLTADEVETYEGPHLPHHGVLKESKSTPIRLVFNSSITFNGHSLNDYWEKGPDLFNDLLGVLLRFRENSVALVGDISKMYHRIRLTVKDQHVHRFLWRNMNLQKVPDTYVMNVLTFGDKPAPAMAMTALRKTADERQGDLPEAANTIRLNSYMDDICDSVNSLTEATDRAEQINEVLAGGGFTIKDWKFSQNTEGKSAIDSDEKEEKVLG